MPTVDDRRADDARLVSASRAGDPTAFPALFDRWFDRCVDVAWRILHDRDAAADVAQDAFLAAWRNLDRLRDPASFGGWVLRAARNRALDRLDHERRSVVIGDDALAAAVDDGPTTDEVAAVAGRAEQADLVWAASAALGERDASILDLHLRHDLAVPEIAEALGVTPNNAHQLLFRLRRKLSGAIRAWVLWRDGRPACDGLAGPSVRPGWPGSAPRPCGSPPGTSRAAGTATVASTSAWRPRRCSPPCRSSPSRSRCAPAPPRGWRPKASPRPGGAAGAADAMRRRGPGWRRSSWWPG